MMPLVDENKALQATILDLESGIQKAHEDRDLAEANAAN